MLSVRNVSGNVDPVISNFMLKYRNEMLIADKVFPVVNTNAESGTYFIWDRAQMSLQPTRRAAGAAYRRGALTATTGTYRCEEEGWEIAIDKRIQKQAVKPMDPVCDAAEAVSDVVLLRREFAVLNLISNGTGAFAAATAAVGAADRWDNPASDPIAQVNARAETIRTACGHRPNKMVISDDTWHALKEHVVLVDRISATKDQILTLNLLQELFDIETVLRASATRNTAEEGQPEVMADIMGTNLFLGYVTPSPSITKPSVGYTIQSQPFQGDSYYENQTKSDVVRGSLVETQEVTQATAGFVLTTIIN